MNLSERDILDRIEQELAGLAALPTHLPRGEQTPGETQAIARHHHRLELLIELLEPDVNEASDVVELAHYLVRNGCCLDEDIALPCNRLATFHRGDGYTLMDVTYGSRYLYTRRRHHAALVRAEGGAA